MDIPSLQPEKCTISIANYFVTVPCLTCLDGMKSLRRKKLVKRYIEVKNLFK